MGKIFDPLVFTSPVSSSDIISDSTSAITSPDSSSALSSDFTSPVSSSDITLPIKRGGRLPGLYTYETVKYGDNEYSVITIKHKNEEVLFVIDQCNLTKVLSKSWHLSSGRYIATHYTLPNGKSKELYLHNFIKDNCMNESSDSVIMHINNNMLDNRIENLRVVKECEYFPSRNNRKRIISLPPDSGFTADDIPKYVSFMKASGEHGDRFAIEIPQLNLFIKMSSSKKILLKDKFEETKEKLNEIYKNYPHINPQINDALKLELNRSLEYILQSV